LWSSFSWSVHRGLPGVRPIVIYQVFRSLFDRFEPAVVVAMPLVRVVQVSVDQIIHMVTVQHLFMPTVLSVHVRDRMRATVMLWRAEIRISRSYHERVLVCMIAMGVVEMAIVEIIRVAIVRNSGVAAIGSVYVSMRLSFQTTSGSHSFLPADKRLPKPSERRGGAVVNCEGEGRNIR
jgi:hypothetical protein